MLGRRAISAKDNAMNTLDQLIIQATKYLPGTRDEVALKYLKNERFRHTFCSHLEQLCNEIDECHGIEPEIGSTQTVIHYTSINALVSMLERAARGERAWLRLYDSVHLNDPDEGNYLARTLPPEHSWLAPRTGDCAYLSSFIFPENGESIADDLVFWRMYGLEGQGCSLSLKVKANRLRRVRYGPSGVASAQEILMPVLRSLKWLKPERLSEQVKCTLRCFFWDSLKMVSYLYKDKAYEYENECRFVLSGPLVSSGHDVHFEYEMDRRQQPLIRHYCNDDDLELGAILASGSSITLGPCVRYPEDVRSCLSAFIDKANKVRSLKSEFGFLTREIKFSEIPYRNF